MLKSIFIVGMFAYEHSYDDILKFTLNRSIYVFLIYKTIYDGFSSFMRNE